MEYQKSFEDFIKDWKTGTIDLTKKGECTGCGACCSNILPLTEDEKYIIRKYIKKHHIKEHKNITFALANPDSIDMTCPFLDTSKPDKKCDIYEVRPSICRDFVCNKTKYDIAAEIMNNSDGLVGDYEITFMREEFYD